MLPPPSCDPHPRISPPKPNFGSVVPPRPHQPSCEVRRQAGGCRLLFGGSLVMGVSLYRYKTSRGRAPTGHCSPHRCPRCHPGAVPIPRGASCFRDPLSLRGAAPTLDEGEKTKKQKKTDEGRDAGVRCRGRGSGTPPRCSPGRQESWGCSQVPSSRQRMRGERRGAKPRRHW